MSRHRKDPLRPLTAEERQELTRLSRSLSAPAAHVERARALLAIADGASYTTAAHQVGRRHNETISAWVSRFNREGLAAVRPGHGGGPRIRYGADAQQRILAEWARTPQRDQDGTATWSLSLLQKALRQAPDGLPKVSTFTIWRTLHEAGLSWQKSRTWCETGVVMRQRKHGVVRVSDPDAMAQKKLIEQAYTLGRGTVGRAPRHRCDYRDRSALFPWVARARRTRCRSGGCGTAASALEHLYSTASWSRGSGERDPCR